MAKGITEILRKIKTGESVTLRVEYPKQINTIRSTMYRMNSTEPEQGKKYSCVSNFAKRKITITANPA